MGKRIALFGGAFDPPHMGHHLVINALLNSNQCDAVWVVPSGKRHDKEYQSRDEDRLQMTRLMVELFRAFGHPVELCTVEFDSHEAIIGTYELVKALGGTENSELFFVVGEELLQDLPTWRHAEKLREEVAFLALKRGGVDPKRPPEGFRISYVEQDFTVSVSSTGVRRLCKDKMAITGLVSQDVGEYIVRNNLYS